MRAGLALRAPRYRPCIRTLAHARRLRPSRSLQKRVHSYSASGLCPSRSPLLMCCFVHARRLCPSRSPSGAQRAPEPPAFDACCMMMHRRMPPLCHALDYLLPPSFTRRYAFILSKPRSSAASCGAPVGMRAKRSAYECIESGIQGTKSLAGSAEGAAALCRRPRRAIASRRHTEPEVQGRGRPLPPAA
jgi:hypothetical protein